MRERCLILAVFAALSPVVASACSPSMQPLLLKLILGDRPIKVSADCGFTHAGQTAFEVGTGSASEDAGWGRVSQIISIGEHACSIDEYVLVADCQTEEALMIRGGENPHGGGDGIIHSADLVREPTGPISIVDAESIEKLAERARKGGFAVIPEAGGFVSAMRKKNRFDPFCGCKLYYPDLAEASQ